MKLTRIDFEGFCKNQKVYATAQRKERHTNDNQILVTTFTPEHADGREHWVNAACEDDVFSMADCLQCFLDGYKGSNSEIHTYYNELLKLSDL